MEADKEQYFGELEVEYKIYLFTRPHCAVEHLRAEVLSYAAHKYNTRNRYQRQQISTSIARRHSVQSFTSIEIPAEITLNEKLRVQVETKKLWTRGRMEIFQLT